MKNTLKTKNTRLSNRVKNFKQILIGLALFGILPIVASAQTIIQTGFGNAQPTDNSLRAVSGASTLYNSNSSSGSNAPSVSSGCSNITSLDGVVTCVSGFFNAAIYLLMSFALLYTVWSALQFIRADGESRDEWRDKIVAGIIGLFVMSAIWGLVNILTGTFSLNNSPVTPPKIGK